MKKVNSMFRVIKNNGEINQWDMLDEARVSIRDYQNLRAYLRHKYDDQIKYDKETQAWCLLEYLKLKEIEKEKLNATIKEI